MGLNLVIVNTGCANIASVRYAIERLGYKVTISAEPEVIYAADKVFLPGVGSANAAMTSIKQKGLQETLQSLSQPTLGICLGMQLMCTHSEEGNTECLNLIDSHVNRMQVGERRLPHMGWNKVTIAKQNPLFDGIDNEYFYFVHSYSVQVGQPTIATCEYEGEFSASIQQNNFYGVQFHPERSGNSGAKLLQNFIEQVEV